MPIACLTRIAIVAGTAMLSAVLSGCLLIPIPFRPASMVVRSPPATDVLDTGLPTGNHPWPWGESVGSSIARNDPRVAPVDPVAFLTAAFPKNNETQSPPALRDLKSVRQSVADFVLLLSSPHDRIEGGSGVGPYALGYDQSKRVESVEVMLFDVRSHSEPIGFTVESHYAQTAAGIGILGFATIGLPEGAVRQGLTNEVIRLLGQGQPKGPIRLVILRLYLANPGEADNAGKT